jgi:hypothetical protein
MDEYPSCDDSENSFDGANDGNDNNDNAIDCLDEDVADFDEYNAEH